MDVSTITMDKAHAKARLDEYREALVGREPTDEDKGIIMGYTALAKGKAVIDLHDVFRKCPEKTPGSGQPAFAVARAHWRTVLYRAENNGEALFDQAVPRHYWYERKAWHRRVALPIGTLPANLTPRHNLDLKAVVPIIPANLRPTRALNRYCILWEAEWETIPVDPMLIRHIHGSLYAVLACWDLTAIERAVLAGRLGERPS